jgi:TolB-like protein
MRPALVVSGVALAVIGAVLPALARERLAVLISVEGDRELADNLSEVVIAKLSSSSEHELVGQRELSERLLELDVFAHGGLVECVEEPRCLAGVGTVAGAKLAVIGRIERKGRRFSLEFRLVEMETGFRRAVVSKTSGEDTAQLIATVEEGVIVLFDDRPLGRANPLIAHAALGAALVALSAAAVVRVARKRLLLTAAMFGVAAGIAYLWR